MDIKKIISDSKLSIAAIVILRLLQILTFFVLAFSGMLKNTGAFSFETYAILGISAIISYIITPGIVIWVGFRLAKRGSSMEECLAAGFLVAIISGSINTVINLLYALVGVVFFASFLIGSLAFVATLIADLMYLVLFSIGGLIFGLVGWGIAQIGKPSAKTN